MLIKMETRLSAYIFRDPIGQAKQKSVAFFWSTVLMLSGEAQQAEI